MGLFEYIKRLFGGRESPPRGGPTLTGALPPRIRVVPNAPAAARQTVMMVPGAAPPTAIPPRTQTPPAPQVKKLDLDASQFAPISGAEALRAARASSTVRANPWWGRLDTIPPASDDRTMIIDRSLVAYGLLKPEELVEIHTIGDRMLELKGDEALASLEAQAAVAASDAERKRIKEQKKAEAAERKRTHAEAVAHRKATDIIFLGRGVSMGLSDRRSNIERLRAANLPVFSTPADVAAAMGIDLARLRWLAFHSDASEVTHYIRFTVPKKSGGVRELAAPHRELGRAQRWIFQNILGAVSPHAAAHGFVRGRSICTNAAPHVGRHTLVNADLKDFFPTITVHRVIGVFRQLGYSPAVATVLALLCTECPRRVVEYSGKRFHVATGPRGLPQGACTSPAISNLVSRRMDSRLAGIAAKLGWTYTRYADDLTFSAGAEADPASKTGYLLARLRHIAEDEGFVVNEKKTRVQRRNAAMCVTGIVVNERSGVRRRERRRLRAALHNAAKAAAENPSDGHVSAKVRGKIAFVQMVNAEQARPLVDALRSIQQ